MDRRKRSVRCSLMDTTDMSGKGFSSPRRTEGSDSVPTMPHAVGPGSHGVWDERHTQKNGTTEDPTGMPGQMPHWH